MNIVNITDLEDSRLDIFSRTSETQLIHYNEPDPGVFIAESAYVILRALEAGYRLSSLLVEEGRLEAEGKPVLEKTASLWGSEYAESIPVYVASKDILVNITGYELVRGLWGVLERRKVPELKEFCEGKSHITVLYDVVNPANVGAIIRSAAALGMDGAVLTHASVDPLTRRSARVSMGTVFQLPWTKVRREDSEGIKVIEALKELGYKTIAMALTEDSVSVGDKEMLSNEKLAVVMGTEGNGLPKEVIAACDYRVMIPMQHGVDSLNVAAASAVSFWEISKSKR
ncbi:MAG: RNA methyltransferase [Lachnospiraceae bacterium]|nr:RNA methyltransferase [Lachnospiraceae bacterium]